MGEARAAMRAADPATPAGALRASIGRGLAADGYWAGLHSLGADPEAGLLALARSLGELYVPEGCDPSAPVLWTRPTLDPRAAPFDRREPIGWHGDFASHDDRPAISLVYVSRPDPAGELAGAWRLASVARLIERLRATAEGRAAVEFLTRERLPFSYAEGRPVRWFPAIESRPGSGAIWMRFYEPSIVRGCLAAYGEVPGAVADALRLASEAADAVADLRPTPAGSLLVINNWEALHDRVEQSVTASGGDREALLAFVVQRSEWS
jgi:hypothetical protein